MTFSPCHQTSFFFSSYKKVIYIKHSGCHHTAGIVELAEIRSQAARGSNILACTGFSHLAERSQFKSEFTFKIYFKILCNYGAGSALAFFFVKDNFLFTTSNTMQPLVGTY